MWQAVRAWRAERGAKTEADKNAQTAVFLTEILSGVTPEEKAKAEQQLNHNEEL